MASAPTTSTSTKETTNYARLCRLLVDVGSLVLRDTFDKIHQPADLHKALASAKSTLQSLRKKRVLNPTQWGKLYPTISSSVSSANFDITLLVLLLRNICGLSPPATGWDSLPPAADTSIEANIARIKFYRNTVYGHVGQASVDDSTFDSYWKEISSALVGLGAGASYADHITKLKTDCMDPDIEEHYKDLLKEWKKDEENTKDKLGDMKEMLKKLKQDGERINNKLDRMEGEIKLMVESQQNLTDKLDKMTKPKDPEKDKYYDYELYKNYSNSDYDYSQDDDYGYHYDDFISNNIKLMVESQQNLTERLDKMTKPKDPDQDKDYDYELYKNYSNSDYDYSQDDDYGYHYDDFISNNIKLMVESQQNLTDKLDKMTKPKDPYQVKDYDDELYENYSNSNYDDSQDDYYGDHYDDLIADDDANNHYFGEGYDCHDYDYDDHHDNDHDFSDHSYGNEFFRSDNENSDDPNYHADDESDDYF